MRALVIIVRCSLIALGLLLGAVGALALLTFPSDAATAEQLRTELQNVAAFIEKGKSADGRLTEAYTTGTFGSQGLRKPGLPFRSDLYQVVEWKQLDLNDTSSFPGGAYAKPGEKDYLLCYWRGESMEILDSKTGRTSLDHQLSIFDRLPFALGSLAVACGLFYLARRMRAQIAGMQAPRSLFSGHGVRAPPQRAAASCKSIPTRTRSRLERSPTTRFIGSGRRRISVGMAMI